MFFVIGTSAGSPLSRPDARPATRVLTGPFVICRVDLGAIPLAPVAAVAEGSPKIALGQWNPGPLEPGMSAGAAPRPVERIGDEAGLDRVER
jgi:hypothetical protein